MSAPAFANFNGIKTWRLAAHCVQYTGRNNFDVLSVPGKQQAKKPFRNGLRQILA